MRQGCLFAAVIVAGALLVGCGGGRDTESIESVPATPRELRVSLDYPLNAANVAIQMAIERGYFEDVGLRVTASSAILPSRPVLYATSGTDDLVLTQQPQVALARENGAHVVAVGSLISQPTAAMIWLEKSKIEGIADLEGKTIAVPGIPYQEGLLEAILARAGLKFEDVEVKRVAYDLVPALLHGKADAIFGGSWNIEGIQLQKRGAKPVIRRVQDFGIPSYDEVVVVARSDRAAKEPQTMSDFMSALMRGAAAVKREPKAAMELVEASNTSVSHVGLEAQLDATIPLMSTTGRIDPRQAENLAAWIHEHRR